MRKTPVRALALALLLSTASPVPFAFAQPAPAPAPATQPAQPTTPADQPATPPKDDGQSPHLNGPTPVQTLPDDSEPQTPPAEAKSRTPEEIYSELQLFGQVFDRVRAEYVDKPDEQKLIRAAIQGMLSSLDPHSGYLDPQDYSAMQVDTSGEFGGLGIQVTMEDGTLKVVSPIDDTPAARAGILPNDFIVAIDGTAVDGMSLDDAVKKMRGPVGTKITLTIARKGSKEPIKVTLTRETIAVQAVKASVEGDVGILRLTSFSEQAYSGLKKGIDKIYKDLGRPPKGLILDLRNNPGGLVDQAVKVADAFLPHGSIVMTRGRIASEDARYDAKPDALDAKISDIPVIVLINGGTASAAEIVSGALQDHKRATVLGTRSFGKASVQSIISLGQDGAMRITTARYYTPDNRSIQASGIQPDIQVLETVPDDLKGQDTIMGEAALPGQIGGGSAPEATTGSSVYVPPDKAKDDQLQYAIKLIDGKATNPAYPPKANG